MNKIGDFIHSGGSVVRWFGGSDSIQNCAAFGRAFRMETLVFEFALLTGFILMMSFGMAATYDNPNSNWQANQPTFDNLYAGDFANYWPILSGMKDGQCNATTDFVIGIPPGGCSPSVVRSDLLAEQNVPVFCELYAIKVNPLIKVSSIKSISFKGDYPEGVRSIVYHPARAAVKSYSTLLGDPTLENIGYVVIILKQEKVEANISEWIFGNLTATMTYDAEEAYGTGAGDYYLEPTGDSEWSQNYMASSFWNGRGYLRVLDVGEGSAKVQIMGSKDNVLRTLNLKEGETSTSSYLPGFYCKAGLKVKLTDITTQEDMARLNVDGSDIWVRTGSKFLDGKCSVRSLDVRGNNDGDISISCNGAGAIKSLSLSGEVIQLRKDRSSDGTISKYNIGDKFGDNKVVVSYGRLLNKDVFLVFADSMPKADVLNEILALKKSSKDFSDFSEKVKKVNGITGIEVFDKSEAWFFSLGVETGESREDDIYFTKSVEVVRDELVSYYGNEEKEIGGTWAEEALREEIELAGKVKNFTAKRELIDLFLDKYPLAETADYVRDMRAKMDGTDYSNSFVNVYVGDEFKSISIVDFKAVSEGSKTVDLKVGNNPRNGLNESDNTSLGDSGDLEILEISPGQVSVRFKTKVKNPTGDQVTWSGWIKEGDSKTFDGINVYVNNINVKEVAHVSLIPDVQNEKSEADFTFRIGVEKRAIELSPEKAAQMIVNLNKSIEKWEGIVERLGNVVTGLKGACFATSAVLMVKSMVSGVGGVAAARSKVMVEYRAKCKLEHPDMTMTQCYNLLEPEIEASVAATAAALNGVNVDMKAAQEGNVADSGGLLGGEGIVSNEKYRTSLAVKVGIPTVLVNVGGTENINVPVNGNLSVEKLQAIMLWQKATESGDAVSIKSAEADMNAALRNVALTQQAKDKDKDYLKELQDSGFAGDAKIQSYVGKDAVLLKWDGQVDADGKTKIQYLNYNAKNYKLILDGASAGNLGVKEIKTWDAMSKKWIPAVGALDKIKNLIFAGSGDSKGCTNPWPKGTAKVSYYELGDNSGLPAIVPFDLENGWYAWVKNSAGAITDDSVQGYKASGDVSNLYICNIGNNGLMESGTPDDICQSFYENSLGSNFVSCPGIDATELYSRARQAIREAQSQYGEKSVKILGEEVSVGVPAGANSGVECQDFMSPTDCKMMFNVCDPVICPPSRCDFGGKFPVSDVIQTGIIGSLVLCLPNAKEGIFMPVCLSGVHAGFDSYVSILKSERECLQHSIETGEMIGICDQITSVYKCEFFWRQMSPLMDQVIPGIIGGMFSSTGKGIRGGGEYALVEQSYEVMKKSISYFKDTYAQNAFKAFNIRSTQEIGSSVCKAFIGTSVPGSASFIENLLAPESPTQFYAQFSEQTFTEATVPATSQYKVYYHIYAGNDVGAQYKVYLRDPPQTSYYASTPEVSVKSGYIAAGSSADESIDFTAPSGYKELCVVVNAKEECGFKQATTSFALDYISAKYTEDQVTDEDIRSEKECISGNPSALSMVNLNVQAGLEESINPDIALRGIVRVCASENPGAGVTAEDFVVCKADADCGKGFFCKADLGYCQATDGTTQRVGSRWKDVGYCGEASLRCWLDTDSVKEDLAMIETFSGVSSSILDERRGLIENTQLDLAGVAVVLAKARKDISGFLSEDLTVGAEGAQPDGTYNGLTVKVAGVLNELDKVIGTDDFPGAGTNGDRAEALSLKASVFRLFVGEVVEAEVKEETGGPVVAVRDLGSGDYGEGVSVSGEDVDIGSEDAIVESPPIPEEGLKDCSDEIGVRIIEIAREVKKKKGIDVASIISDNVAGCFEELALMIAMQESGLKHCEDQSKAIDCFSCGEDNLRSDYDPSAFGVMQINIKAHPDFDNYGDFNASVKYALEKVLIDWGYNMYKGGKDFNGVTYKGWRAAIRAYNGWGSGGDDKYVDNVLGRKDKVKEMFPNACE